MYELALGLFSGWCVWLYSAYAVAHRRDTASAQQASMPAWIGFLLLVQIMIHFVEARLPLNLPWFEIVLILGQCFANALYVVGVLKTIKQRGWSLPQVLRFQQPRAAEGVSLSLWLGYGLLGVTSTAVLLMLLLNPCSWLDRRLGLSGCRYAINGSWHGLAFNADNSLLAANSRERLIVVDMSTGAVSSIHAVDTYVYSGPFWSPDNQRIAVTTEAQTGERVVIIEVASDTVLHQFDVAETRHMQWSPDGRYVVGSSTAGWWLWDSATQNLTKPWDADIAALSWTPDGQAIASLTTAGRVELRDFATNELLEETQIEPFSHVHLLAYLADGTLVAHVYVSDTEQDVLWNIDTGTAYGYPDSDYLPYENITIVPAANAYVICTGQEFLSVEELAVYSFATGDKIQTWTLPREMGSVALAPDLETVAFEDYRGLYIWELP